METAAPASTLAKPLAIVAMILGALGCLLVFTSRGPEGTQLFLVGASLFVPGLPLAVTALVIGIVRRPRALLLPGVALAINLMPVLLFFFLLSVLSGMRG